MCVFGPDLLRPTIGGVRKAECGVRITPAYVGGEVVVWWFL